MNEMERKLFKKLSQRFTFFKLMQDGDFYIENGDYISLPLGNSAL